MGSSPSSIGLGDFNNDGNLDFATGTGTADVRIRLGNGAGGFSGNAIIGVGPIPRIAIGDFNNDGNLDFATANQSSDDVTIRLGDGFGNFSGSTTIATDVFPNAITIADFNGDGKADFAVAATNGTRIHLGDGLGGFSGGATIAGGKLCGLGRFQWRWQGRRCGSKLSGSSISIALWTEALPPVITSFTPTYGPVGTSVTITGTNFDPIQTNNIVYFGATKAIVSSASSISLTVVVPPGATYQPITVNVNGLIANSFKPFDVTFAGGTILSGTFSHATDLAGLSVPRLAMIGDADGDGKPDVAVTNQNGSVSIFENTSDGSGSLSFSPKQDFTTTSDYSVAMGDLDGDGKLDLVQGNSFGAASVILRTQAAELVISATILRSHCLLQTLQEVLQWPT